MVNFGYIGNIVIGHMTLKAHAGLSGLLWFKLHSIYPVSFEGLFIDKHKHVIDCYWEGNVRFMILQMLTN